MWPPRQQNEAAHFEFLHRVSAEMFKPKYVTVQALCPYDFGQTLAVTLTGLRCCSCGCVRRLQQCWVPQAC